MNVEEPTKAQAIDILKGLRHCYEEHHGIRIEDSAIEAAVNLSERYINDRYLPDKAIDLIDEACSKKRLSLLNQSPKYMEIDRQLREKSDQMEDRLIHNDIEQAKALK